MSALFFGDIVVMKQSRRTFRNAINDPNFAPNTLNKKSSNNWSIIQGYRATSHWSAAFVVSIHGQATHTALPSRPGFIRTKTPFSYTEIIGLCKCLSSGSVFGACGEAGWGFWLGPEAYGWHYISAPVRVNPEAFFRPRVHRQDYYCTFFLRCPT